MSLNDVRREIAEWDPFGVEPDTIASITLGDDADAESERPTQKRHRRHRLRSPSFDYSRAFYAFVAESIEAHALESDNGRRSIEDAHVIDTANAFNVKFKIALTAWRRYSKHSLSAPERRECEQLAAELRRLAPLRHLIALADAPEDGNHRELDSAFGGLAGLAEQFPELLSIGADLALALDLVAKMRDVADAVRTRLFEIYESLIESHPTLRSRVVNYTRHDRVVEAIYPPGTPERAA